MADAADRLLARCVLHAADDCSALLPALPPVLRMQQETQPEEGGGCARASGCCEPAHRYAFHPQEGSPRGDEDAGPAALLVADEESPWWCRCGIVAPFCCCHALYSHRPLTLRVAVPRARRAPLSVAQRLGFAPPPPEVEAALVLRRPLWCCVQSVHVTTPAGDPVARIDEEWRGLVCCLAPSRLTLTLPHRRRRAGPDPDPDPDPDPCDGSAQSDAAAELLPETTQYCSTGPPPLRLWCCRPCPAPCRTDYDFSLGPPPGQPGGSPGSRGDNLVAAAHNASSGQCPMCCDAPDAWSLRCAPGADAEQRAIAAAWLLSLDVLYSEARQG